MKSLSYAACALYAMTSLAMADVTVSPVISDNMVIQREKPVWIWGKADAGENVSVSFAGESGSAVANEQGQWKVKLGELKASDQPATIDIKGKNTLQIKNVLIGEVWLASGQSNMEYPMQRWNTRPAATQPEGKDANADALKLPPQPTIRLLTVDRNEKTNDLHSRGWRSCDSRTLAPFSAVAYFFGKELSDNLHVPIGLIDSSVGGTRIEPWTPPSAYAKLPRYKTQAASQPVVIDGSPTGTLYSGMIAPLIPLGIRGVIWYQGEANVSTHDGLKYADKMKALIGGWREAWGQGEFPFYYAQIAPYLYNKRDRSDPSLPEVWEAQNGILHFGKTGMAATSDLVADINNIHPSDKVDVGHRFALIALAHDYGQKDLVYSGPTFDRCDFQGDAVTVSFSNAGSGLSTRDGKAPALFEVAGADKKYYPAEAKIDGVNVLLTCKDVSTPLTVHFAWREDAVPNLMNKEGLPALPFRTDGPQADAY